jgi:hypothetical protein
MERKGTTFDSSVGQVTKSPNVAPIFPMIRCAKSRLSVVQGIGLNHFSYLRGRAQFVHVFSSNTRVHLKNDCLSIFFS